MNGAQQIVGGLLAYCFSLIKPGGPLRSWEALFIAYGCFTVLYGGFVMWWMPDSPMRAKCFSEADKRLMVERVRSNQTGLQNRKFRMEHLIEAVKDPQMYGYCLIQICTTLPTSGLGAFANIIITGFDFTTLQTQLLAMVLGFYIIIVLFSSMWLVNKFGQNLLVMGVYVIPYVPPLHHLPSTYLACPSDIANNCVVFNSSFIGTIVLMTVENTTLGTKVGLLISYYITLSFWSAQTLALSMITRNIAGQTKKSVVVAANFIAWSAGNAIGRQTLLLLHHFLHHLRCRIVTNTFNPGPQVFLDWDKPRYFIAFATHIGCYSLLVVVIVALRWYLRRENKKKDEQTGGVDENMVHAFDDLTDKENLNFRYIY